MLLGAVFATVFTVLLAVVAVENQSVPWLLLLVGVACSLLLGIATAPPVVIETVASRRPPSISRDALAFAATAVAVFAALVGVSLQIAYALSMLSFGDPARALRDVKTDFETSLTFTQEPFLPTLVLLTAPFPVATVARLRHLTLRGQTLATVLGGSALAVPSIVVWLEHVKGAFALVFVVVVPAYFATVPIGLACADRVETWLAGRLAREAD